MDIQEYIASGILEAYVLGDLSPSEEQAVRDMLSEHADLRDELAAIEKDFEALAQSTAIQPTKSFEAIIEGQDLGISPVEASGNTKTEKEKIVPFDKAKYSRTLRNYKFTAIAASLAALVASVIALNYYSAAKSSEASLADLQAEQEQYAENYNIVKDQLNDIQSDLAIIDNPDNQRITLEGTEVAPDALAYAYWNKDSEDLYLSIQNLKSLAENQQYQLWAIIDGQPVDAGVFDWNEDGLVQMKSFGEGVSLFAVTIEPRGGSEGPSLETMQVNGAPGGKS